MISIYKFGESILQTANGIAGSLSCCCPSDKDCSCNEVLSNGILKSISYNGPYGGAAFKLYDGTSYWWEEPDFGPNPNATFTLSCGKPFFFTEVPPDPNRIVFAYVQFYLAAICINQIGPVGACFQAIMDGYIYQDQINKIPITNPCACSVVGVSGDLFGAGSLTGSVGGFSIGEAYNCS